MSPVSHQELTVLLADDDLRCRESLAQLLIAEGFKILAVAGGVEALSFLRPGRIEPAPQLDAPQVDLPSNQAARSTLTEPASRIHVLVLDYEMPDLNGLEVLRVLREEYRIRVPSIMVTGRADPELEVSVLEHGAFALAPKPIEPVSFRELIWQLISSEIPGYRS